MFFSNKAMNQFDDISDLLSFSTQTLIPMILILCAIFGLKSQFNKIRKGFRGPPSPLSLPILGHLYLLSKYPTNPWMGFNEIRKKYGNVVSLMLGQCKTVMISSPDAMREVLLVKGDIFCDRPSFYRHSLIFGRDKQNSLALCDWSDLQKVRRSMAQMGILPRYGSKGYKELSKCIESEVEIMIKSINEKKELYVLNKDNVLILCANIFLKHLCSRKLPVEDEDFIEAVHKYDFVFYDINQCYAIDFIPFLSIFGFCRSYFNNIEDSANSLRKYIETEIVSPRLEETIKNFKLKDQNDSKDFLDSILKHFVEKPLEMNWTICMFEIGDLIGGHSAVGNLLMRLIGHLAVNQSVQQDMHIEAHNAINRDPNNNERLITLEYRPLMPLTEASILETLRIASSPIVPHVTNQDTTLQGYDIERGTMILFNTYHLNTSEEYWTEPQKFNPSRFVKTSGREAHVSKPDHFFPFSSGRRSCLGYKMVNTITFAVISNLLLNFKIVPQNDDQRIQIYRQLAPKGCLALSPDNCFKVALIPRTQSF